MPRVVLVSSDTAAALNIRCYGTPETAEPEGSNNSGASPVGEPPVALFNGAIGLGAMIGGIVLNSASSVAVFAMAAVFVALGALAIYLLHEPMSNEAA